MKIRVGDFKLGEAEKKAINEVLDSGRLSEGPKVLEFEKKWAEYIGTKYAVATSSGFGALMVGLLAMKYYKNIPNGSKVITTPITYIADSSAISLNNSEPIYVDIDPETFVITPEAIENHLKNAKDLDKYSIILPVDLMGYSVKIDEINEVAEKYGLSVFEDPAQAHGTLYKGKKAGSQALLADYSFYIAHNIQAGEMGALVTNDSEIYRLAKKLKAQGRACECPVCVRALGQCPGLKKHENDEEDFDPRFSHDLIGFNFKTMEFQAALALIQLEKADEIIKKRLGNVKYLNEGLAGHSNWLQLPKYDKNVSYLAYPLVIKDNKKISRKVLRDKLEKMGIENRPLFGCIPTQQQAYAHLKEEYIGKLSNSEYIGSNAFYIGCHQYLEKKDLDYIIESFHKIAKEYNLI